MYMYFLFYNKYSIERNMLIYYKMVTIITIGKESLLLYTFINE